MNELWKSSPLVPFFISFSAGIILFEYFPFKLPWDIVAVLAIFVAFFFHYFCFRYSVLVALFVCLFSGYYCTHLFENSFDQVSAGEGELVLKLSHKVRKSEKSQTAVATILTGNADNGYTERKLKLQFIYLGKQVLHPNQIIRCKSRLQSIDKKDSGYEAYLYRKGVRYKCFNYQFDSVSIAPLGVLKQFSVYIQGELLNSKVLLHPAIINGICFGDKSMFKTDTISIFKQAGFMHLLAVSGMHVGFVSMIVKWLVLLTGNTYRKKHLAAFLAVICIWIYIALAGFTPSACRAGIMFSVYFGAELLERDLSKYNLLAFTAIILLAVNPLLLFDVGFQLSFAAMLGITFVYRIYNEYFQIDNKLLNGTVGLFVIAVGAQLGTLPFCLYQFGYYSTYSLLFGTVAGIVVFLIVLALLLLIVFLFFIGGNIGYIPVNLFTEWLVWLARTSSSLPYAVFEVNVTVSEVAIYCLLFITGLFVFEMNQVRNRKQIFT